MGWENYHLHLFTIGGVQYGEPDPEYADEGIQIKHDRHASVRDVLRTEGMRFRYDYDFGDNWRHDVLVEHIELFDEEDWVAPRCLDGRRAGCVAKIFKLVKIDHEIAAKTNSFRENECAFYPFHPCSIV